MQSNILGIGNVATCLSKIKKKVKKELGRIRKKKTHQNSYLFLLKEYTYKNKPLYKYINILFKHLNRESQVCHIEIYKQIKINENI